MLSPVSSRSLARKASLAAALLLTFGITTAMRADSVTYNFSLVPSAGYSIGGSGTMTISSVPASTGDVYYTQQAGTLTGLTFSIDGQSFSLDQGTGNAVVEFQNGAIWDITFSEEIGNDPYEHNRFSLHTTAGYDFAYADEQQQAFGTFALGSVVAATPEPSSLLLLGTGILGAAGMLRRRFV